MAKVLTVCDSGPQSRQRRGPARACGGSSSVKVGRVDRHTSDLDNIGSKKYA